MPRPADKGASNDHTYYRPDRLYGGDPGRRPRRPPGAACPYPLARPGTGRPVGSRRRCGVDARVGSVLARHVRLATAGVRSQLLSSVHHRAERSADAFSPCARGRPRSAPATASAWLARISLRVSRPHSPTHPAAALQRRPSERLHGHRALAAGIRVLVPAGPETLRYSADRRLHGRADERRARLRALRRPGGDWGAHIATSLGVRYANRLAGIHLNFLPLSPTPRCPRTPRRKNASTSRSSAGSVGMVPPTR